jgi:pimeloyl-ACP methyl ester carboxylesterase
MDTASERDRSLEAAQTALLSRHPPGTRVRRVRWSQGETQVLELGAGSPLLLVHGALGDGFAWVPILPSLARNHRILVHSHLNVLRCLGDAGGLRRDVILGERWQDLKVPTVFLWGERDTFLPPEAGEAIAVQNSNLHVMRIPDAGHLPWIDNSERIVGEIEHFLAA